MKYACWLKLDAIAYIFRLGHAVRDRRGDGSLNYKVLPEERDQLIIRDVKYL
jgi:hypothetical protein